MEEENEEESEYSPSEGSPRGSVAEAPASEASTKSAHTGISSSWEEPREIRRKGQILRPPRKFRSRSKKAQEEGRRIGIEAYRKLFNEVIRETVNKDDEYGSLPLPASQVGYTTWSAEEKAAFFYALDRRGKDDVKAISKAIKTKSPPEIRAYLAFLQNELAERNENLEHPRLLEYPDLPAALEIRPECESVLDQAADVLAERQFRHEMKEEKDRFGTWSLIDRQAVFLSEDGSLDGMLLTAMPKELRSAIELLKVETLVDLSDQILMNPNYVGDVRERNAKVRVSPSILTTAVLDFHTLAVTLTKRLVQSTLFFAMSRLRATKTVSWKVKPRVRTQDVNAALDVLGVKGLDQDFWASVARKYRLDVYDEVPSKRRPGVKYDYDQVEQMLRSEAPDWDQPKTNRGSVPDDTQEVIQPRSGDRAMTTDDDSSFFSDSSTDSRSASHTAYARALDRHASQVEEVRLLELLCGHVPPNVENEEMDFPPRPKRKRKSKEDLADWRHWVGYKSEWERYQTPLVDEDFEENRRKRRKRSASLELVEGDVSRSRQRRVRAEKVDIPSPATSDLGNSAGNEGYHANNEVLHDAESSPKSEETDADGDDDSSSSLYEDAPVAKAKHRPNSLYTASSASSPEDNDSPEARDSLISSYNTPHPRAANPSPYPPSSEDLDEPQASPDDDQTTSTTSTSESPNDLLSSREPLGYGLEQDAQERSQPMANNNISESLHSQDSLHPSSRAATTQELVRDGSGNLSDGREEEAGEEGGVRDGRGRPTCLAREVSVGTGSGSDDDNDDGPSFGERLAALRSPSRDLPLRRFLGEGGLEEGR